MDLQSLYKKFQESGKVCTDTRQVTRGSVFFALKGPKFNANAFADEALQKGARYAVVDEQAFVKNQNYILVKDALQALQELAGFHRSHLKIPFIGLTGSNGKTTTKELIQVVLSKKYKTLATRGNFNNHIGVPLTVLAIDSSIDIAVIEMGANHVGEIASLAAIANPTHGLITNIGKAHIGTFGGFENVVRGKSELYQHLIAHQGQVFINSQNQTLAAMASGFKSPLFYPASGDYYHCELLSADPFVKLKTENGDKVTTQLMGSYNFENVAAALCIGKFFGVDPTLASQSVREYVPGNMRSELIHKGTNTIILDAYNANPSSMEAAINNLASMGAYRKVVILGDMYELEENTKAEHQAIGLLLKQKGITEAYLCGALFKAALETYPQAIYFATKDELIRKLREQPIQNATILVKASRGMALETVVEAL